MFNLWQMNYTNETAVTVTIQHCLLVVTLHPARLQWPVLHAGHPRGPEPSGNGGEEGEKVQLQKEEGQAGETLQHQGSVTSQVYSGDWGQTWDSEPSVGRALRVVSTRQILTFIRDLHTLVCVICRNHGFISFTLTPKAASYVTSAPQCHFCEKSHWRIEPIIVGVADENERLNDDVSGSLVFYCCFAVVVF